MILNVDDNGTGKLFNYYKNQGYTPLYQGEKRNQKDQGLVILKKLL